MLRRHILILTAFFTLISPGAFAREDSRLATGWRFLRADPAGAEAAAFDDSAWTAVTIPHSWGWEEAQTGHKDYHRGPAWYRLHLDTGKVEAGKRYFLRFEAASQVADVYLNGKLLGEHRGGFGAFAYEITGKLAKTGDNILAVRVDNALQQDIAPLDGDFSVYGGLYRPVHLIVTEAEDFAITDHGSPGVAWLQTSVSLTNAVLDVNTEISNGTKKKQAVSWIARLIDDAGQTVASATDSVPLAPSCIEPHTLRLTLANPHLWNGRKDPYLYRAVVDLVDSNGVAVLDSVEKQVGLRFYHVDPDKGFFLNGEPYHLHGVNRHQDRPVEGWAITEADMEQDVGFLKEIGATVLRCCHYEHNDYLYTLCDRAGILVWAEIPQVNTILDTQAFENTSTEQLRDLIRQNINHSSIFAWSLFNEIGNGHTDDPHRELQDLYQIAHGEDPTRPVIAATSTGKWPAMNKIPDLLGWNIYPGWYSEWGQTRDFSPMVEAKRYTSRYGGICISEYGAGANINQHEENPVQPKTTGPWHPEEWQCIVHEEAWKVFKTRPYVWGTFMWNMFDFVVADRHEGSQIARNDKGLVTYDRKVRKDAFFFYKANWTTDPMVHINSSRFTERTNSVTNVKVYANVKTVSLSINGVSQGNCDNDGNDVFVWKNVPLAIGVNHVEASIDANGQTVKDSCDWTRK